MNLDELFAAVTSARDVLRVETLDAYDVASDSDHLNRYSRGDPKPDPAEKRAWLDLLRSAADQGAPWRRLRVVSRPVPTYVRYACEFGYTDNVAAGEIVRVVDADRTARGDELARFGDFYVLDRDLVVMQYVSGRFVAAARAGDSDAISTDGAAAIVAHAEEAFAGAADFTDWWAANPDLHRNLAAR